ncbi:MAG: PIN domain-containing protein [Candidatus Latescibacteria bacterium]|nr:PIN domain-containing protein [Candidatus Latescibacterota bacterium]
MNKARPLLLDTHVWIWLINDDPALGSGPSLARIEKAANKSLIRVSVISVWEVGMLESKGRISLSIPCREWVQRALEAPGLALAPLSPAIALASSRLPDQFHGDPADRILVATARELQADLLTRDGKILEYGQRGHISAVKI